MKRTLFASLCIFIALVLTSCSCVSNLYYGGPRTITIEGTTYRCDFYSNLHPVNLLFTSDYYEIENKRFRRIYNKQFDLVLGHIGAVGEASEGTAFCSESQWEDACACYSNDDNYVFYCHYGSIWNKYRDSTVPIPNIDPRMFDALMAFADKNEYEPFGSNSRIPTHNLPAPKNSTNYERVFHKESVDGLFTSTQRHRFIIVGERLFFVFGYTYGDYNYGDEEHKELIAVDLPEELEKYFLDILAQLHPKPSDSLL